MNTIQINVDDNKNATIDMSNCILCSHLGEMLGHKINVDDTHHTELAKILSKKIKENGFTTLAITIEAEWLQEDLWDKPEYMHKTNDLIVCEAREEARRELLCHYFKKEEMENFLKKNEIPTWKYNYKNENEKEKEEENEGENEEPEEENKEEHKDHEKDERKFRFEVEDAVYDYQETAKMVENLLEHLELAQYKLNEEGWPIEEEEEVSFSSDYQIETDPLKVKENKKILLERYLKPRIQTEHVRVYNMPKKFWHFDSRGSWSQFFFVFNSKETFCVRGNGAGSGTREDNGRWSHTFACLSEDYGIETPTYHLLYNSRNELKLLDKYSEYKALRRDLSGNYDPDTCGDKTLYRELDRLFGEWSGDICDYKRLLESKKQNGY